MYCYHCGQQLNNDAKFCHSCGTQVITAQTVEQPVQQPIVQPVQQTVAVQSVPVAVEPAAAQQTIKNPNLFGIIGLALSVFGIFLFFVDSNYSYYDYQILWDVLSLLTFALPVAGLVTSAIGLAKRKVYRYNGFALAGVIVSGVMMAFILIIVVYVIVMFGLLHLLALLSMLI